MSGYTIGEIVVWLLLAGVLGFVLGWLVRTITYRVRVAEPAAEPTAEPDIVVEPELEPEPAVEPGRFAGSAKPLAGGAAPSPAYTIKGNEASMIYHTPDSRSYDRTTAQTWFATEQDAVAAGFRKPLR